MQVSQAAKHLGLTLEYSQSHGMQHHVTFHLCRLQPYARFVKCNASEHVSGLPGKNRFLQATRVSQM